jgi:hypothetical protein
MDNFVMWLLLAILGGIVMWLLGDRLVEPVRYIKVFVLLVAYVPLSLFTTFAVPIVAFSLLAGLYMGGSLVVWFALDVLAQLTELALAMAWWQATVYYLFVAITAVLVINMTQNARGSLTTLVASLIAEIALFGLVMGYAAPRLIPVPFLTIAEVVVVFIICSITSTVTKMLVRSGFAVAGKRIANHPV